MDIPKKYCVYKIFCKDPAIKEIYYGSTSNFYQRCHSHKHSVKNYKNPKHGFLVYRKMRDTGGFDNWKIEKIKDDMDKDDARILEKEMVLGNDFSLNQIVPARTKAEWNAANPEFSRAASKRAYARNPEYWRNYYQDRRAEYLEKVTCECGTVTGRVHLVKHRRTKSHLDKLENIYFPDKIK